MKGIRVVLKVHAVILSQRCYERASLRALRLACLKNNSWTGQWSLGIWARHEGFDPRKCPEWTAGHKFWLSKRRKISKKERVNVCKLHVCMWFSECWHCPVIPLKPLNGILFLIFNRWVISCASCNAGASLAIDKARNGNSTLSPSDLIDEELKSINWKRRASWKKKRLTLFD